jgi:hypothetical protein
MITDVLSKCESSILYEYYLLAGLPVVSLSVGDSADFTMQKGWGKKVRQRDARSNFS